MTKGKLRWGVLGTARILEKVLPHFQGSKRSELAAIASRDPARANVAAQTYGIPTAYASYAELTADPGIDVIYLALPNHLHAEWTRAALRAGKHVLCEKPLTLDGREASELVALARAKNLRLAEGYMYRHHAATIKIFNLVRNGALGEIRRVQGSFHITIPPGPNIRTNGTLGGGALADVGCYLVNFANAVVGRAPEAVLARGRIAGRSPEDDYDSLFSSLLDYGNGITAQLDGGFLGPRLDVLQILGSEGWLDIPHPFKPEKTEILRLSRRPTRDSPVTTEEIQVGDVEDPYAREVENFAAFITGETRTFPLAEWESEAGVETLARLARGIRA